MKTDPMRTLHPASQTLWSCGVLLACAGIALTLPAPVEAASGVTIATVTIEQLSPIEATGKWTLLMPNRQSLKMSTATYQVNLQSAGSHTLFAEPPSGMSARIALYRGGSTVPERTVEQPQMSFTVAEGDTFMIKITYLLTRTGDVAINSNPSGVPFELSGPDGMTLEGVTPHALKNVPEGQYTVRYLPEGCITPRPQSLQLKKDGRLAFNINISCATLEIVEKEREERIGPSTSFDFVSVRIGTQTVVFEDVPLSAWFAPYVFRVAKAGVISGYRDTDGNLLGRFGPENNVTVAELAKLAHEVAGIDERETDQEPQNRRARGQWFSPYVASAEQRDWVLYRDRELDPSRASTRGEVLVTLLQALDIALAWPKGEMFRDVSRTTPYAAAIETAAADGIVSGSTDAIGNQTGLFNPAASVNRAEIAKILGLVMEVYLGVTQ